MPGNIEKYLRFLEARGSRGAARTFLIAARLVLQDGGWFSQVGQNVADLPAVDAALRGGDPAVIAGEPLAVRAERLRRAALRVVEVARKKYRQKALRYAEGNMASAKRFLEDNPFPLEVIGRGIIQRMRRLGPVPKKLPLPWAVEIRRLTETALVVFHGLPLNTVLSLRDGEVSCGRPGTIRFAIAPRPGCRALAGDIPSAAYPLLRLFLHRARPLLAGTHGDGSFFPTRAGRKPARGTVAQDLGQVTAQISGARITSCALRLILGVAFARPGRDGSPRAPDEDIALLLGVSVAFVRQRIIPAASCFDPNLDRRAFGDGPL